MLERVYQNFKTLGDKIKIILQFCVSRIITREWLVFTGHKPHPKNNPEQTWLEKKNQFFCHFMDPSNTQITLQNDIEKKNNNNILHLILLMYDEHGTKVA